MSTSINVNIGSPRGELVLNKTEKNYSFPNGKPLQTRNIRQLVCAQQGEIAQGIFLSLEHHKRIREALDAGDLETARNHYHSLNRVTEHHLRSAWHDCVRFVKTYFRETKPSFSNTPRICLKATKPKSNGSIITDVFRGSQAERTGLGSNVNESSAFSHVRETGLSYLCNDIPESIISNRYKNRRLDLARAGSYAGTNFVRKWYRKRREICSAWAKCWSDYSESDPPNRFYRSTLVVPVTLVNNDNIEKEFDDFTILGISRNADKTTYAFLCFDHPAVNYFRDDAIDIGYIVADLLSFHFMARHTLIDSSETASHFQQ